MLDFLGKANTSIYGLGEDDTARGGGTPNKPDTTILCSMLGHRLRRWPNIEQAEIQRMLFGKLIAEGCGWGYGKQERSEQMLLHPENPGVIEASFRLMYNEKIKFFCIIMLYQSTEFSRLFHINVWERLS